MKTQIIEIIDRKIKENQDTGYPDETRESILEELKQEILDTPEWIDVKRKLPVGKIVALQMSEGGKYFVRSWTSDCDLEGWAEDSRGVTKEIEKTGMTHWQPLPNPPDIQS